MTRLHFLQSGRLRGPERSYIQLPKNKTTFLVRLSSWLGTFLPTTQTGNYLKDVRMTFRSINGWALSHFFDKTTPARQPESFSPSASGYNLYQCSQRERSQHQAFRMPHGGCHSSVKRNGIFPCKKMGLLRIQSRGPSVGSAPHNRGRMLRDAGVLEGTTGVQGVRKARHG